MGFFYLLIPAPSIVFLGIVDSYLLVYEKNFISVPCSCC